MSHRAWFTVNFFLVNVRVRWSTAWQVRDNGYADIDLSNSNFLTNDASHARVYPNRDNEASPPINTPKRNHVINLFLVLRATKIALWKKKKRTQRNGMMISNTSEAGSICRGGKNGRRMKIARFDEFGKRRRKPTGEHRFRGFVATSGNVAERERERDSTYIRLKRAYFSDVDFSPRGKKRVTAGPRSFATNIYKCPFVIAAAPKLRG